MKNEMITSLISVPSDTVYKPYLYTLWGWEEVDKLVKFIYDNKLGEVESWEEGEDVHEIFRGEIQSGEYVEGNFNGDTAEQWIERFVINENGTLRLNLY